MLASTPSGEHKHHIFVEDDLLFLEFGDILSLLPSSSLGPFIEPSIQFQLNQPHHNENKTRFFSSASIFFSIFFLKLISLLFVCAHLRSRFRIICFVLVFCFHQRRVPAVLNAQLKPTMEKETKRHKKKSLNCAARPVLSMSPARRTFKKPDNRRRIDGSASGCVT